jgi:hypothetical protein
MCTFFRRFPATSLAILISLWVPTSAQTSQGGSRSAAPAIREQIDETRMVPLRGNVRSDLTPDRDLGPVEDELPLRLYMVLQRSPAQQAELENLMERQQQPTAAEYHRWITPQQFGERFGASEQDIATISAWLESRGMHVQSVMNNASFIDFSATARNVRETFGTQLHYFNAGGGIHPGLIQDPMIPAALATVVAGIEGLNKIPPHANHTRTKQASYDRVTRQWQSVEAADSNEAKALYTPSAGNYFVTPQDFYTIYNVNPVFTSTKGANANVAVIEESDIEYGTVTSGVATGGDVATFRNLFGVNTLAALTMHVYHGYGTVSCNAPGIDPNGNGEDGEASLDAEWASALAPAANLIFMSCDQKVNQGIITSEMALIDNNLSDTMSLSYGNSELNFTSSNYTTLDTLYAQAAAQGQSFLVSAGDSGSDVKDQNTTGTATSGVNVSAFASSPNVTAAGGTDFVDTYDSVMGGAALSTYWGATNTATFGDALGYVPETAWNDSCASSILAAYEGYTGAGLCNAGKGFVSGDVVGGSGGFSAHYAVPSYQSGITGYSGTMRAQPDISAFASNGFWSHALVSCDSHVASTACDSTLTTFAASGGTSYVAPQMAGIFALLVSYTGSRQGLLNPALYALAKAQFTTAATQSSCYSNGTTSNTAVAVGRPASSCIFNDVTSGNNDEPCAAGATGCYINTGGSYGILSRTGATSLTVAYPSTAGYDEVTGIGTLNVNNLLTNWNKAFTSTTKVGASLTSLTSAQSTSLTATITGGAPTDFTGPAPGLAGTASFKAGTTALGKCTISSGTCSLSVSGSSLAAGANSITATFSGSRSYPASTSSVLTVTVTGTGTPVASLSATSLPFGTETIGVQSAAQTVTLKNTGTATLDISSIAFSGAAGPFVLTANTCGATLAATVSCTFSAAFKPTTTGAFSATIAVADNASGSPQTVALTGTGSNSGAVVSLSAGILSFGTESVGVETPVQTVTLKNVGTLAVTISSISLTGTGASSYLITANTCGTSLAVAASCIFSAAFKPTTTGSLSAGIAVTDNATGSPQSVALNGTGSPAGTAVTLSATNIGFGPAGIGLQTPAFTVTVKNTGTVAASLSSIVLGGAGASSFVLTANTCGSSLAVAATCIFSTAFKPTVAGALAATVAVTDNVAGSPQIAALSGTGVTTALTLTPGSLSFASENVGSNTAGQLIAVKNTSAAAITLSSFSFTGADPTSFAALDTCTATLAVGATCQAMVSFFPQTTGALTASLSVASSVPTESATLSGTGIATAALTFSPSALTFPTTAHGTQSVASILTVANTGTTTAMFGFIGIGGTNPAEYSQLNSCGTSLAAGAKCSFFIVFKPAAAAAYTATLELFDNAQGGYQGIALSGTGN